MLAYPMEKLHNFLTRHDGGMVILGLFLFVGMLFTASLALDMARYEQERVRLQGVADRAALAAANIRHSGDGAISAEQFLRGYFLAEGFTPEQLDQWTIVTGDGVSERSVTVMPRASMNTLLMSLVGVDDLPLAAAARAEVALAVKTDVVLVLDISGSMASRSGNGITKLDNLKAAATAMVNDLTTGRSRGEIAISIVPYESWVVPPAGLLERMRNIRSGSGGCTEFEDWNEMRQFLGNGFWRFLRERHPRAANAIRRALEARQRRVNCGPMQEFRVTRPFMTEPMQMIEHINSLQPINGWVTDEFTVGRTSIDQGVRYGALMLSPDLRTFVDSEIQARRLPSELRGRPLSADDADAERVMVLMTDGQNCCDERGTTAELDERSMAVCDNLKAEGVTVFSVAFEAPRGGVNLMRYCASSDGHFFNTNGAGLTEAFQAIGRQINGKSLRLTQ